MSTVLKHNVIAPLFDYNIVNITFKYTGKPKNLCGSLYCSGLEPKQQYVWGIPELRIHKVMEITKIIPLWIIYLYIT